MSLAVTNIEKAEELLLNPEIRTLSFDIDGTLYPMRQVKLRWWWLLWQTPLKARRFLRIKETWELRRKGTSPLLPTPGDVEFFENFLLRLYTPRLVPAEIRSWLNSLKSRGYQIIFLSDHGADVKLRQLGLLGLGESFNCLSEVQELKPHPEIAAAFIRKFHLNPRAHLHLGDRWTDEEQARLMECHFSYFIS